MIGTGPASGVHGDGVRGSYGPAKDRRLAAIKTEYDPGNMFRLNASIPRG